MAGHNFGLPMFLALRLAKQVFAKPQCTFGVEIARCFFYTVHTVHMHFPQHKLYCCTVELQHSHCNDGSGNLYMGTYHDCQLLKSLNIEFPRLTFFDITSMILEQELQKA